MIYGQEIGTLVVPYWPSATWWPLLLNDTGIFQDFVVGCQDIPIHPQTLLPGQADNDLFGHGTPTCRIWL